MQPKILARDLARLPPLPDWLRAFLFWLAGILLVQVIGVLVAAFVLWTAPEFNPGRWPIYCRIGWLVAMFAVAALIVRSLQAHAERTAPVTPPVVDHG